MHRRCKSIDIVRASAHVRSRLGVERKTQTDRTVAKKKERSRARRTERIRSEIKLREGEQELAALWCAECLLYGRAHAAWLRQRRAGSAWRHKWSDGPSFLGITTAPFALHNLSVSPSNPSTFSAPRSPPVSPSFSFMTLSLPLLSLSLFLLLRVHVFSSYFFVYSPQRERVGPPASIPRRARAHTHHRRGLRAPAARALAVGLYVVVCHASLLPQRRYETFTIRYVAPFAPDIQ